MRGNQIALPPGASGPSRAGLRLSDRDWATRVKTFTAVAYALFCREISNYGPRSINPTTFIDTGIFALYFILVTTVSKNYMHLFYYQKNKIINAKFWVLNPVVRNEIKKQCLRYYPFFRSFYFGQRKGNARKERSFEVSCSCFLLVVQF